MENISPSTVSDWWPLKRTQLLPRWPYTAGKKAELLNWIFTVESNVLEYPGQSKPSRRFMDIRDGERERDVHIKGIRRLVGEQLKEGFYRDCWV